MSSKPLRADARRNRAKILDAAGEVFAERGVAASTEEVAARAGVAIGTVFRHFPTKQDLLGAILKDLLADLTSAGDTDLFAFFTRVVTAAAEKKVVVELLAREGVAVGVEGPVAALGDTVDRLLAAAREAGAVRADVRLDEVLALLTATAQGALWGGWPADLRERVLARVFAGLVA
ncbi:TetR/AcrR family transcriptional regulator [Actinophytocola algeriensis]|uniref:AcrR family transcriptional regulator n=1 Tax=Actinophytocola algeriensis TaxID=1768010 RepID=A0A7W7VEN9_9PSEU|nr:TetR/AcrR family transcriptional regulator [Actinophytocola algeriensis]MBB4907304.1 AcrR family transcriptional regulator [Actinophytocola algeriensis]MBE1478787.1 AcrR family transcriptional regulator [Actinophytocola algeriensis]